jgi:hypothetical protein
LFTYSTSSPSMARLRSKPTLMPAIAVPISVTATMPMITPSAVRADLILFALIWAPAIRTDSTNSYSRLGMVFPQKAGPSLSIRPSCRRMMRRALRATASSCVTTMSVLPAS